MNDDEDETCEEHEPQQVVYYQELPNWQWSTADTLGVVLTGIGALFIVTGQTVQAVAREFNAAGQFGRIRKATKRQEREEERAAREEIANLREMYEAGSVIPEPGGES